MFKFKSTWGLRAVELADLVAIKTHDGKYEIVKSRAVAHGCILDVYDFMRLLAKSKYPLVFSSLWDGENQKENDIFPI